MRSHPTSSTTLHGAARFAAVPSSPTADGPSFDGLLGAAFASAQPPGPQPSLPDPAKPARDHTTQGREDRSDAAQPDDTSSATPAADPGSALAATILAMAPPVPQGVPPRATSGPNPEAAAGSEDAPAIAPASAPQLQAGAAPHFQAAAVNPIDIAPGFSGAPATVDPRAATGTAPGAASAAAMASTVLDAAASAGAAVAGSAAESVAGHTEIASRRPSVDRQERREGTSRPATSAQSAAAPATSATPGPALADALATVPNATAGTATAPAFAAAKWPTARPDASVSAAAPAPAAGPQHAATVDAPAAAAPVAAPGITPSPGGGSAPLGASDFFASVVYAGRDDGSRGPAPTTDIRMSAPQSPGVDAASTLLAQAVAAVTRQDKTEGEGRDQGSSDTPASPFPDPAMAAALAPAPANAATSAAPALSAAAAPQPAAPTVQVAGALRRAASEKADRIEIKLQPEALGAIEVKLHVADDGTVSADVKADRADTLQLLASDSRNLEQSLRDGGLRAESGCLNFSLRGDGDPSKGRPSRDSRSGGRGSRVAALSAVSERSAASRSLALGAIDIRI